MGSTPKQNYSSNRSQIRIGEKKREEEDAERKAAERRTAARHTLPAPNSERVPLHLKNKLLARTAGQLAGEIGAQRTTSSPSTSSPSAYSSSPSQKPNYVPDYSSPKLGARRIDSKDLSQFAKEMGAAWQQANGATAAAVAEPDTKGSRSAGSSRTQSPDRDAPRKLEGKADDVIVAPASPQQIRSSRMLLTLANTPEKQLPVEEDAETPKPSEFLRKLPVPDSMLPAQGPFEGNREKLRVMLNTALHMILNVKTAALPKLHAMIADAIALMEKNVEVNP